MTPKFARKIHIIGMIVWASQMLGSAIIMNPDWKLYLLEISQYANFVGHWSGLSAERPTEVIGENNDT